MDLLGKTQNDVPINNNNNNNAEIIKNWGKNVKTKCKSSWNNCPMGLKVFCIVLLLVILVCVLFRVIFKHRESHNKETIRAIQDLCLNAQKWANTAKQDDNIVLQLMHLNYSLAHMNVVRRLATDEYIEKIAHVKSLPLISKLEQQQKQTLDQLSQQCPQLNTNGISESTINY